MTDDSRPTGVAVGVVVVFGAMMKDKKANAELVVSPQQIAQAKAEGKLGRENSPGLLTVLPIRSEKDDMLPPT
ncbi:MULTISPECIES: hypothetical protein [Rhizobium]|uniref:hypothetical protein n=1 Tax=Rhizobium TaxID=379 RepID=UPI0010409742|nr:MULTISPECIES: hypothetical protein [Rhizobium]MBY4592313.1 hypothetical protein [Rhizobium redzepovicii]MBY4617245.1 hypothetical protein [Rhizobium redzepovicii]TBY44533.1 hypothetical protein E0H54_25505 [Rhizobium leguminosarum bv. viciae]